ncbi:MAG: alpha-L-fucosidase [Phycisphaerae bacterium]
MHRIPRRYRHRIVMATLALAVALAGCAAAGAGGAAKAKAPTVPPEKAVQGTAGDEYPWSVPLAKAPLDDDPLTSPRTLWYREGKFGMFIHWGVYAVPAGVYKGKKIGGIGEWIMDRANIPVEEYEKFPPQFNPVKFDAEEWVRLAKTAGMTYMVITSKHHDGFAMYDSKVSEYDIIDATPFDRDPMKELAAACKKHGLKFCFYHSIMDWHHPKAKGSAFDDYHKNYLKPQVKELITRYGPLGIMWFDGEWIGEWTQEDGRDMYRFCRDLQPSLIVNNRVGKRKREDGDYETPEQNIPAGAIQGRLWETCMTMNDTWGYKKNDDNWKSDADLVRKLIDIASKGGNFLLNVGPKADGTIPQPSVTRLKQVGRWLSHNGEAIYGTTQSPWHKHPFDGRCTVDGNTLYVHVFAWDGPVRLPGLKGDVKSVRVVDERCGTAAHKVTEDQGVTFLELAMPATPDLVATVVAVEFDGPPEVDEDLAHGPPVFQKEDGRIVLPAERAVVHGNTAKYESGGGKDNIGFWTDKNDWVGWPVKVTQPGTFKVEVTYAAAPGSGGATYHVYANAQKVNGKVEETGGWSAFKTVDLGQIEIPKAGRVSMAVKPQSKPGTAVMNLKSVTLTPVK